MTLTRKHVLLIISTTSFMTSGIFLVFNGKLFDKFLAWQFTIREGSAAYHTFVEVPVPMFSKFYFFDVLNPGLVLNKEEKPILKERGPYTFREVQRKVNITWNANGTVTYRKQKYWYFQRSLSVGPLTDLITTINIPLVSAAEFARGSFLMEWAVSDMITSLEAELFVRKTVKELLFEGYEDTILEIGSAFTDQEQEEYDYEEYGQEEYDDHEEEEEEEEKEVLDKFGFYYKRNGTSWAEGEIEMRTGEDDIARLGEIVSWNQANTTQAFQGDCSKLRGSAEGLFPPGLALTSHSISIYSTDLCRPLHFSKTGTNSIHGVPVATFELDPANFANTTNCTDNHCYNNNLPTGVQNVTQCRNKSPVFVSRPHFHLADPTYLHQFQAGLSPEAEKHNSLLWLEPLTSVPVKFNLKLQINFLIRPNERIDLLHDMKEVLFPVIWFEFSSEVTKEMSGPLYILIMLPTVGQISASIILIISSIVVPFYILQR